MLRDSVFLQRVSSEDFFAIACLHLYFLFDSGLIDVRKLFHFDNKDKQRSKVTMTTSPESTVALAALTAVTIRQQMLSLASSTLKLAASALRFQQQQQQQQLPQAQITATFSPSLLPEYSLDQVSWHSSQDDCWIVIYDKVYNITEFLHKHPGGLDVLLEYAGRDATLAFRGVGHSSESIADMERYLIGILPASERMYLRKF